MSYFFVDGTQSFKCWYLSIQKTVQDSDDEALKERGTEGETGGLHQRDIPKTFSHNDLSIMTKLRARPYKYP